jgi:hypothetical protein
MGYVAGADVQIFLRAADFAVFPFRRVTTSSVMLALAFDVPVIIPGLPSWSPFPARCRCAASDGWAWRPPWSRQSRWSPTPWRLRRSAAAYTRRVTPHWDTVAGLTATSTARCRRRRHRAGSAGDPVTAVFDATEAPARPGVAVGRRVAGDSLFRNSFYLMGSSAVMAGIGSVLGHRVACSRRSVGQAAALVAAFTLARPQPT